MFVSESKSQAKNKDEVTMRKTNFPTRRSVLRSTRGYSAIGLCNPKSAPNLGGALRAAHCYGVRLVNVAGTRYTHFATDTTKAWRHIPTQLYRANGGQEMADKLLEATPMGCIPIAVELCEGAQSLVDFSHPERAHYIFGPEDGSLPEQLTDRITTVYVPTQHCMNLSCCINVVMYDRLSKRGVDWALPKR